MRNKLKLWETSPWIAMEYMDGGSLRRKIGKLKLHESLEIAIKICEAFYDCHHREKIHRDIKPENILFDSNNNPKVTDWGLGKIISQGTARTTGMSTPSYSAPEQLDPEAFGETDWRTDNYQIGLVIYEMVTGSQCFTPQQIIKGDILYKDPIIPSMLNPQIPPFLDAVILKALAKKKESRYQDVSGMEADLKDIVAKL